MEVHTAGERWQEGMGVGGRPQKRHEREEVGSCLGGSHVVPKFKRRQGKKQRQKDTRCGRGFPPLPEPGAKFHQ